ncbi:BTB/POZ domain-containing protein 3-like [Paramacrobiotus metropolitanus]|uniref:BTB/POZ domain-containing protein 3-like n=1 Tax=Paramacrobiotus metropolitanus TaxID=2943436 RepID=UPI00244584D5|nr:BTB/POZ domain-containing protein 3-like [Paramacrobiotus metropolitanus]
MAHYTRKLFETQRHPWMGAADAVSCCTNPRWRQSTYFRLLTVFPVRRGAIDGVIGRMKRALSLAELSDVQFAVGRDHGQEKIFHAHNIFLSLSSDVFHAMFFGNLADNNQDIIQIPEIPSAAFANMLSYIYENAVDDLNWQNVFPTLYCADMYDLPWLAEICCVYIQVELNTKNCLIALENINVWGPNFDSIVEACLDLIDASDGAVFQSEYFTGLSHGTLQMVVQRPTLAAPEYIIYTAVEAKWHLPFLDRSEWRALHGLLRLASARMWTHPPLTGGKSWVPFSSLFAFRC